MLERSPSPHRRARLVAVVRRVLNWPARVAEARRTLAFLGQMTDRELGDIGLLRSDLADCAALPLDEDPSHKLARLRAARAWFAPGRRDRSPGGAPPIFDGRPKAGRRPTCACPPPGRATQTASTAVRRRRNRQRRGRNEIGRRLTWRLIRMRDGLPYKHSLDRSMANRDNGGRNEEFGVPARRQAWFEPGFRPRR